MVSFSDIFLAAELKEIRLVKFLSAPNGKSGDQFSGHFCGKFDRQFGGIFIVRKINIKYSHFAHLEDLLTMNLEVEAAKKSIIILHAKIRVNNIEILRSNMSLAFYNPESMRTQSLPDEIRKKIMEEF